MPVSRTRKRKVAPGSRPAQMAPKRRPPSPPWFGALILFLLLFGVAWLVVYYVTGGTVVGQDAIGAFNLVVGFGLVIAGFALATQWR